MCVLIHVEPLPITASFNKAIETWFLMLRHMRETLPTDYEIREDYFKTTQEVAQNIKNFYANGMIIYILDDYYEELVVLNNSVIRTFAERVRAHKKRLLS